MGKWEVRGVDGSRGTERAKSATMCGLVVRAGAKKCVPVCACAFVSARVRLGGRLCGKGKGGGGRREGEGFST